MASVHYLNCIYMLTVMTCTCVKMKLYSSK